MNEKEKVLVASGAKKASLVLKNAQIVNVFSNEIEIADIAIEENKIVGVGSYNGHEEVDCTGLFACSGFIDGHIHLESSMITPQEFYKAVAPHGTTAVVCDPHEIVNICGEQGLDYMLNATKELPMDVFFMLPSCVPSSPLDEAGAEFTREHIEKYINNPRVLGLGEVMDFHGVVNGQESLLQKINSTKQSNKMVDGHAPFLSDNALNAYVCAGVASDHECSNIDEALLKLKKGQYIMIREGTAAKNLMQLLPLFNEPYCHRSMLVTDDKHPEDLINDGHIDSIIRKAVKNGADPINAIKMGTFNAAQYFKMYNKGAIAPGFDADVVFFSSLEDIDVVSVYKNGKLTVNNKKLMPFADTKIDIPNCVTNSFNMPKITAENFETNGSGTHKRVIYLIENELLTKECIVKNDEQNIMKLAVIERHKNTGNIGIGYLGNYGLKNGAVATSFAHDSHNLIVVGTNNSDMALAANTVRENKGGIAVVVNGEVVSQIALPIAGIMSKMPIHEIDLLLMQAKNALYEQGVSKNIDPFMTLAFTSLPVIPQIRLTTKGLVNVETQQIVSEHVTL